MSVIRSDEVLEATTKRQPVKESVKLDSGELFRGSSKMQNVEFLCPRESTWTVFPDQDNILPRLDVDVPSRLPAIPVSKNSPSANHLKSTLSKLLI